MCSKAVATIGLHWTTVYVQYELRRDFREPEPGWRDSGSSPGLSKVAGIFPVAFWGVKGRGGLRQGTLVLLMVDRICRLY